MSARKQSPNPRTVRAGKKLAAAYRKQFGSEPHPSDPRLREAVARLVLPEGWTIEHVRLLCNEHPGYGRGVPASARILAHIADRLDGPLAEAWERSLRAGIRYAYVDSTGEEQPDSARRAVVVALRALTEETGE